MENKRGNIIVLAVILVVLLAIAIYLLFFKKDNNANKIYVTRDGIRSLETIPQNLAGKYVNNTFSKDYFILNSDGTAEKSYIIGSSEDNGMKDYFNNNELTFEIIYQNNNMTIEFIPKDSKYKEWFSPLLGIKNNNQYYFEVTEPTVVATPGETKYIKE